MRGEGVRGEGVRGESERKHVKIKPFTCHNIITSIPRIFCA